MSELHKFPMAMISSPNIIYKRLTGVISNHMHTRAFIIEEEDGGIVIWTTSIVRGKDGKGESFCYSGYIKHAITRTVDEMYRLLLEHNYPPKFPAFMYDHDLSAMNDEQLAEFLLNFEYFDIQDYRGAVAA